MSTKATGNKKHLTLADRAAIEHGISRGENFTQIACRINKDSSTISKEIRRHLFRVPHFQNETQRKLRMRAFSELCKAAYLRESDL